MLFGRLTKVYRFVGCTLVCGIDDIEKHFPMILGWLSTVFPTHRVVLLFHFSMFMEEFVFTHLLEQGPPATGKAAISG